MPQSSKRQKRTFPDVDGPGQHVADKGSLSSQPGRAPRSCRENAVIYDAKYHPMDEVVRPRSAAVKRRSGVVIDIDTSDESETDEYASSSSTDDDEQEDISVECSGARVQRSPDVNATRRSKRTQAQAFIDYSTKRHPQDHSLPFHRHKSHSSRNLSFSAQRTLKDRRTHSRKQRQSKLMDNIDLVSTTSPGIDVQSCAARTSQPSTNVKDTGDHSTSHNIRNDNNDDLNQSDLNQSREGGTLVCPTRPRSRSESAGLHIIEIPDSEDERLFNTDDYVCEGFISANQQKEFEDLMALPIYANVVPQAHEARLGENGISLSPISKPALDVTSDARAAIPSADNDDSSFSANGNEKTGCSEIHGLGFPCTDEQPWTEDDTTLVVAEAQSCLDLVPSQHTLGEQVNTPPSYAKIDSTAAVSPTTLPILINGGMKIIRPYFSDPIVPVAQTDEASCLATKGLPHNSGCQSQPGGTDEPDSSDASTSTFGSILASLTASPKTARPLLCLTAPPALESREEWPDFSAFRSFTPVNKLIQ